MTDARRLYRSRERLLAGVCGGIGEYFSTDPTVIRLAWVLMTILTGIIPGMVAYGVMAVVIPPAPSSTIGKVSA